MILFVEIEGIIHRVVEDQTDKIEPRILLRGSVEIRFDNWEELSSEKRTPRKRQLSGKWIDNKEQKNILITII